MENAFGQPQSVVVLGGTSDIARALTRRLCAARARTVVLCGRDPEALADAESEAHDAGAWTTAAVAFDATDLAGAGACVDAAFAAAGEVDLVVVAVGRLGDQGLDEDDPARAAEVRGRQLRVARGRAGRGALAPRRPGPRARRRPLDALGGAGAPLPLPVRRRQGRARPRLPRHGRVAGRHRREPAHRAPGLRALQDDRRQAGDALRLGVDDVADAIVGGLAVGAPVIWCPPALRYVAAVLRVLPAPLWRIVAARA